jgi:hypothetical protein
MSHRLFRRLSLRRRCGGDDDNTTDRWLSDSRDKLLEASGLSLDIDDAMDLDDNEADEAEREGNDHEEEADSSELARILPLRREWLTFWCVAAAFISIHAMYPPPL